MYDYYEYISYSMKYIIANQFKQIEDSALLFHECVNHNHRIFFFGTGHSYIIGQEVFARAGGYGYFVPILENELGMNHAYKSTMIERNASYADVILSLYNFQKGDVIVITSNSGRNPLIIELALKLKKIGLKIIGITSLEASKITTSRHKSGYRLFELCDIVLDNCSPYGDALIKHTEDIYTGPTSTILGCYIVQLIVTEFVNLQIQDGKDVSVYRSSNVDDGDSYNEELFKQYLK